MSKAQFTERELTRYSRNILLKEVGEQGQHKLKDAKVLVIGAGGLGCPVLQYLTAAGIGTIGIVDFDIVDESNLQRQVLFDTAHIGMNKARAAKDRLTRMNPLIKVVVYTEKLDQQNALELFRHYDIVVDGTDNLASRYLINDASILTGKPVVYGAIHRFEGQVSVFNYQNGPSYRCLFPENQEGSTMLNCSELGVIGVLPGMIGTYQANEVMKIILGTGEILSGKLMLVDSRSNKSSIIHIARSNEVDKVLASRESFGSNGYALYCDQDEKENLIEEITAEELNILISKGETIQFVDVRGDSEPPSPKELTGLRIPVKDVLQSLDLIDQRNTVVVYCHSGVRSLKAISKIQATSPHANLMSLQGGVKAWMKFTKETEKNKIELELS
ncbi:MAG: molybdopterin-synthase adenylyltransferase MoeB [Flavobacteriales bacterium]|jgi:sulfur-carrier protein adenylyltransferase/sulfurtransferase|nr:molybdopterin-synthase adenylyltransferase MoeB [Flavobacteriales bacterium]NCG29065.1 molybdopterin-synthase adenylyltransferase MoeB [Bacteroidota bacterium]MBT4930202.1 molybdopterin-synthase adenylyltransferase MoeB [Flavobacteriales bacterium]MBT5133750.1 molybdopterin-synthase adenylyltransferase MoeB [Flavobacteriales bacterium]MBT5977760.1 molybdopterin-synthase adenylyltransferase MoeB [Flavobacteriales bacterium]